MGELRLTLSAPFSEAAFEEKKPEIAVLDS
jgi:hypothetical protein